MATTVYLVKRYLKKTKRNGTREHRWALRWEDPDGWHCESTGTADKVQAEELQKAKWAALNIPGAAPIDPEPAAIKPTWQECRNAVQRAMLADNMRPTYINDSLLLFDSLPAMFPVASPADLTADDANEYKRRRFEAGKSPWTVRGDLSTLRAVFGKWLGKECGLLKSNPFANVKPPRCEDPDVRLITVAEIAELDTWLGERWSNWKLPATYLQVAALLGWRATEIASIREADILPDGFVRVMAETSKTRRQKHGWLPPALHADLRACSANGWAFGRFSDDLRRLLILWQKRAHHAARVRDFEPKRFVGWMQDELQRFHKARQDVENEAAEEAGRKPETFETFTLHDFRRTAITGMQMAGVSEKETSVMVGATPEVIRRHYEKMDQQRIARQNVERRLGIAGQSPDSPRASCAPA